MQCLAIYLSILHTHPPHNRQTFVKQKQNTQVVNTWYMTSTFQVHFVSRSKTKDSENVGLNVILSIHILLCACIRLHATMQKYKLLARETGVVGTGSTTSKRHSANLKTAKVFSSAVASTNRHIRNWLPALCISETIIHEIHDLNDWKGC